MRSFITGFAMLALGLVSAQTGMAQGYSPATQVGYRVYGDTSPELGGGMVCGPDLKRACAEEAWAGYMPVGCGGCANGRCGKGHCSKCSCRGDGDLLSRLGEALFGCNKCQATCGNSCGDSCGKAACAACTQPACGKPACGCAPPAQGMPPSPDASTWEPRGGTSPSQQQDRPAPAKQSTAPQPLIAPQPLAAPQPFVAPQTISPSRPESLPSLDQVPVPPASYEEQSNSPQQPRRVSALPASVLSTRRAAIQLPTTKVTPVPIARPASAPIGTGVTGSEPGLFPMEVQPQSVRPLQVPAAGETGMKAADSSKVQPASATNGGASVGLSMTKSSRRIASKPPVTMPAAPTSMELLDLPASSNLSGR